MGEINERALYACKWTLYVLRPIVSMFMDIVVPARYSVSLRWLGRPSPSSTTS